MPKAAVLIDNHWARFRCAPEGIEELKPFFSYPDPDARYKRAYRPDWDGMKCLLQYSRVGAGLFYHLQPTLEEKGWKFAIERQVEPLPITRPGWLPTTRRFQKEAIVAMAASSGGLVLCATGTGKTHIAAEMFRRLDCACCFIVDELTLLEQTRRALARLTGEPIGVLGRGEFRIERINVATVQTLHRHRKRPEFRAWAGEVVIVLDEFHVTLNRSNIEVVAALKPRAVFGLTATIQLSHQYTLYRALDLAGPVLFTYDIQQGQREGYLTKGLVCRVVVAQKGAGFFDSDVAYRQLIVNSSYRNGCIVALIKEGVRRGRRIVVLVERLRHLLLLHRMLGTVQHQCLSGAYRKSKTERIEAARAMDNGRLPVILATRVFGKGVDIATVDVIIDATATSSINNAQQRYGRGVRRAEGKTGLIHIDIADAGNMFRRAAASRLDSLRTAGHPIMEQTWEGDSSIIYHRALSRLNKEKQ